MLELLHLLEKLLHLLEELLHLLEELLHLLEELLHQLVELLHQLEELLHRRHGLLLLLQLVGGVGRTDRDLRLVPGDTGGSVTGPVWEVEEAQETSSAVCPNDMITTP